MMGVASKQDERNGDEMMRMGATEAALYHGVRTQKGNAGASKHDRQMTPAATGDDDTEQRSEIG